jgi:hypothetical protein
MKAKCLLIGILLVGIAAPAFSGTGWRSLVFQDFQSIAPPALPSGWVALNLNLDQGQWETQDHGGITWGRNCARYTGDPANPANDWIMTSAVALTAGTPCTIKFMTRTTLPGNPFTLEVWAGTAQNPGGMTILALSHQIVSQTYVQDTGNFVVPGTGTYYIGFRVTGPAGSRRLYLDDVEVNVPEADLTLALGMSKSLNQVPLVYSVGDTIEAVVRLKNTGGASALVNKRFAVGTYPSDVELDFYVTGPDGLRLPCINMYAKMVDIKGSDFATLLPDSLAGKVVNIRGWYGFYTPGAYSIQAHYRNRSSAGGIGGWMGELVSDPVAITIQ